MVIIFRKAVPLMEDEKKIVGEEDANTETIAPAVDGTIDNISNAQVSEQKDDVHEVEFIPLDSLLYESEENLPSESNEGDDSFESFFAEYRLLIAENLDAARKMNSETDESQPSKDEVAEPQEAISVQSPAPSKKKKAKKAETKENEEWSGEITLAPEEYEALDEEEEIFSTEPEEEEEAVVDLIGEENDAHEEIPEASEEDIQISFFTEERKQENKIESDSEDKGYDPENPRKIDAVFDFLELFIFTLVAVVLLTTFVFKHSVVEGDSMNNTLSEGDHLIVWDAFYTPERYDIVVFEDYSTPLKKAVVKRIIGLPGETVEIKNGEDGVFLVYVNGELIEEEYAYHGIRYSNPRTGVWTLGDDELFVMGDNRYNSTDSRDERVGPINVDSLLGKVVLRFYPFKDFTTFN